MADNIFENNIVYAGSHCMMTLNKSQVDTNRPPAIIDHNPYYCVSGTQASIWAATSTAVTGFDKHAETTGNDLHSHFSDPHFVDPAKKDFHLQSDSPALADGTPDKVQMGEINLEGSPRVKSGKVDIGCYQRQ